MTPDLRETPIVRRHLPHTGRLDGDDTGYRDVEVDAEDTTDPDPLVPLPPTLLQYPVYALGPRTGVTRAYAGGLGASPQMLLRAPAVAALADADAILRPYHRRLLAVDAFRPAEVQARLWSWVFDDLRRKAGHRAPAAPEDWLRFGRAADHVASYCLCVPGAAFDDAVAAAARELRDTGGDPADAVDLTLFRANHGDLPLRLDESANTAHGSGGACDLLLATLDGEPVAMGAPFDSASPVATVDWFEHHGDDAYAAAVAADPELRAFSAEFPGAPRAAELRAERRLLVHTLVAVGATYYSLDDQIGEFWHFNFGNERGGRQAARLPGGGNAAHSLLRDVRAPETRRVTAAWGGAAAHRLARAFSPGT